MSTLNRQYLAAMGIDCWELRQPPQQHGTTPAPNEIENGVSALYQATHTTLGKSIANMPVLPVAVDKQPDVLILIEAPGLADTDRDLLTAMLGAINLPPEQYAVAEGTGAEAAESITCEALVVSMQPRAILVMAKLPDSSELQPLDHLRAGPHLTDWSRATVSVTLHPRDLIDNPAAKRPAWEDLKRFRVELDT